jgi:hypothetical protein
MLIEKITTGTVVQVFNTDAQKFVSQRFTPDEASTYFSDGFEINFSDFEDLLIGNTGVYPFDMVQPE